MVAVIQRVSSASVEIHNKIFSKIERGLLVLLGVRKGDNEKIAIQLAQKTADLRIFPDDDGKMNLSVKDINGEMLIISQFTLCTDNSKSGNRPSFTKAEEPDKAKILYERFITELEKYYDSDKILNGVFAEDMRVSLINEGPVTIILDK
jgi:D-aminoacyl-tRNA deacylase